MARINECKVCAWKGENPTEEQVREARARGELLVVRKWVGTNHNLCSDCVQYEQEANQRRYDTFTGVNRKPTTARGVAMGLLFSSLLGTDMTHSIKERPEPKEG